MQIVIPKGVETGELKVLPNGLAVAAIEKCIVGKSQANKPKLTVIYTIIEEMDGKSEDGSPTIGSKVLETMSLQPQALFSLAKLWKDATGSTLEQGDWDEKEFEAILNEKLQGTEWNILLETQVPGDGGEPRTNIIKRTPKK